MHSYPCDVNKHTHEIRNASNYISSRWAQRPWGDADCKCN